MNVNFIYIGNCSQKYTPEHATNGASGVDLRNCSLERVEIHPQSSKCFNTGICVEIPDGFEGQLRPRSGLSTKKSLMLLPSVGTIDSDYRGEVKATYFNPTNKIVYIEPHERIAQLVIAPYAKCTYKEVEKLSITERGAKGFGSTGKG